MLQLLMAAFGTKPTEIDVRYLVALWGIADMPGTSQNDAIDTKQKLSRPDQFVSDLV